MPIVRILLFCGIAFYLLPGLIMGIFSIALFGSFIYFITKLFAVLNSKVAPINANNNKYQQAQGVTIDCEEYRVK